MTGVLCAAISGGLFLVPLFLILARWRAIGLAQRPTHYREVALALHERRPALAQLAPDGAQWLTSAGVGVVYSCTRTDDGGVGHHVSLSLRGGPIPLALGLPLLAFVMRTLGVEPADLHPFQTGSGVLHAAFTLDPEQHLRWGERPASVPGEGDDLLEAYEVARQDRDGLLARLEEVALGPLQPGG
jgi:hypothetical protein